MSEIRKIDEAQKEEIIYFELNNWTQGEDFPAEEPFISWMWRGKSLLPPVFEDREWVKENKLAVSTTLVDMSLNYCIAAPKSWVLKNCPNLLEERNAKFVFGKGGEEPAFGRFGSFVPYEEEYIGKVTWFDEDTGEIIKEDDEDEGNILNGDN